MQKTHSFITFLVALVLAPFATGQNEFYGQMTHPDFQLSFWNARSYGKAGYFELYDASEIGANIGIYDPKKSNGPGETIVTFEGVLGYKIPAGEPYVVGISLAEPLYSTSPGAAFTNFGQHMEDGTVLSPAVNPSGWNGINTNQFEHMSKPDLWAMASGDPGLLANWATALPGLPPYLGELSWGFSTPLGIGIFFDQIQPFLPALPPSVGPGGGSLIGMNVVVQIGVLDTNGSTPAATKFTLSNAIGIQAMAGPPIKLNAGSAGNWGPPLSTIDFEVENPNKSMRVTVPVRDGSSRTLPVTIVSGNRVSVKIPADARTGVLAFSSAMGPTPFLKTPVAVITHDQAQDLASGLPATFTTQLGPNGKRIFGASIIGNLSQIQGKTLTIPTPAHFQNFDLEVQVYPLDRSNLYAGYGVAPQVDLGVAPSGAFPVTNPVLPGAGSADEAVFVEECFTNLSGSVDLRLATTNALGFDYLAIIKAVEK